MTRVVIQLDSPLADVIDAARLSKLTTFVPVTTVADLIGLMPVDYTEPARRIAIANLEAGREAVVKGRVVAREGRPASRTSRDEALMSPVIVISDGTGNLKVGFVQDAIPAHLLPNSHVAVRGTPLRNELPLLVREVVTFEMDDPLTLLLDAAAIGLPTPLFDAPAARYHPDPTKSRLVGDSIASVLRILLPLPAHVATGGEESFSGETLAAVLRAIHRPDTSSERDWGWDQRQWALSALGGVRRSGASVAPPTDIRSITGQEPRRFVRTSQRLLHPQNGHRLAE